MSPVVGKVFWLIVNPANVLTGLLVLGALLLFTRWRRTGRFFVLLSALLALFIAYAQPGVWLMEPLEERFAAPAPMPEKVAGIIVLGGAIDTRQSNRFGQVALNGRGERITGFVALARRYPDAKLVYSGGAGLIMEEQKSEAEHAKPLLVTLGVPESRLILETKSRDTYENALLTRELVKPAAGETWILVTSANHMPRAMGTFRKLGWTVIPYPVDYRRLGEGDEAFGRDLGRGLNLLTIALREWLSLAHYYAAGRVDRLLPAP
jgi:uncharacterized SAM-binding protein YcdF (DUF218 family)